ncbi:class I SAM-dependent methyltransferase [Kocuria sp.]|uniref:class I SAM-dependent methyltransferase n=1 Tax=Kocuria sp. TaxID=1871328 RepID=UPI0026DA9B80|nr:class I SAM-dependent methyltransferase [Kocuria sp.]MDO4919800.1 class I SAM-dependent methyltransferase [Kocuria sp.]
MTAQERENGHTMTERDSRVQGIFNRVNASYDRVNTLMTLGRHAAWCREVARRAGVNPGGRLLDIATGTGEIALAARRREPRAEIVGVDFSEKMLEGARRKPGAETVTWEFADAHQLRYEDESFDAVTHGYLLRNVSDIPRVLAEQFRVLRPGGRVVVLETAPPRGLLKFAVSTGMGVVLPLLGRVVARDPDAYGYLKDSTLGFVPPTEVARLLRTAGFVDVGYETKYLGTNVIFWGRKPTAG